MAKGLLPFLTLWLTACTGRSTGGTTGSCDAWRSQPDAGSCVRDSDCPPLYYCDYVLSFCGYPGGPFRWDGGPYLLATFDAGACRADCSAGSAAACHVGEDCGHGICAGDPEPVDPTGAFCNLLAPCDAGQCLGAASYPSPPQCPAGCHAMTPVHETLYGCVCAGNQCVLPRLDAG
ncbi:MAG TPA: hypothetical protein VMB50_17235 [Myxococcales bacterium]|nr:hypothetical protein [Myxococcales bacterium]